MRLPSLSVFCSIRSSSVVVGVLVGLSCLANSQTVQADDKDACYSSFEGAQVLRRKGSLLGARKSLLACAREACPAVVRGECVTMLEDVEKQVPSVLFQVHTDEGDAVEATITMDAKPLLTRLDGKAVDVDPGEHTFVIEVKGIAPKTQRVVVMQGDKNRRVTVDFSTPKAAVPVPGPVGPVAPEAERPVPTSAYVLGGVGLVGLGSFATFALLGNNQKTDLEGSCSPFCTDSDKKPVQTKYLIADISLGVGVASLIGATILYLTRSEEPVGKKEAVAVQPLVGPVTGLQLFHTF